MKYCLWATTWYACFVWAGFLSFRNFAVHAQINWRFSTDLPVDNAADVVVTEAGSDLFYLADRFRCDVPIFVQVEDGWCEYGIFKKMR